MPIGVLIGGPCAGQQIEFNAPTMLVPYRGPDGLSMQAYHRRRVRWGRMSWYVGTPDTATPVHPVALLRDALALHHASRSSSGS